jgi:hypothetical protein
MNCVNCGRDNPKKALICFWCGLDPETGETPYPALDAPAGGDWDALTVPEIILPPPIEIPSPALDQADRKGDEPFDLTIPEPPPIEIAPPPDIPSEDHFTPTRRRVRQKPVVRISSAVPPVMHALLPTLARLLVFIGGLLALFLLGLALFVAVGAASFGAVFCLVGLLGFGALVWVALLAARVGRRVMEGTGELYERFEVLGQVAREVAPGLVQEFPLNLPGKMDVLEQPFAYSELRALAGDQEELPTESAEDLLTGAITNLVARDDVILAQRNYPVEVRGALTRSSVTDVNLPVLTRRRPYSGSGELEGKIVSALRTDRSMTVEELIASLSEAEGRQRAREIVSAVNEAVSERSPDLDVVGSPQDALAEFERYRETIRRTDPELYQLLEDEVKRGLSAVMRRPVPSSLMDLARYASDVVDQSRALQL